MKKLISMIALAAISFGSVYAHATVSKTNTMQTDTTKKKKKPMKKDTTMKKDSTRLKQK
ncbi:MAG TPA: hypothetical protein VHA56_06725 [Mucilaginibacter sp.]|nr:hypothetical protein [Mucilaginibacter sp.]